MPPPPSYTGGWEGLGPGLGQRGHRSWRRKTPGVSCVSVSEREATPRAGGRGEGRSGREERGGGRLKGVGIWVGTGTPGDWGVGELEKGSEVGPRSDSRLPPPPPVQGCIRREGT